MRNHLCSEKGSSPGSEAAPMYTPANSFPLSPPSGRSPPTSSAQNETIQSGTVHKCHVSSSNIECATSVDRYSGDSSKLLYTSNQIKDSLPQSEPCRTAETLKYSRNAYAMHSGQTHFPRPYFPNNGNSYYDHYCTNTKSSFHPTSDVHQNSYYEGDHDKSSSEIASIISNKIHSELDQYYGARNSERLYSMGYNSVYGSLHSFYNSAEASTKNSEFREKDVRYLYQCLLCLKIRKEIVALQMRLILLLLSEDQTI
ncbi:hypothetical protein CEXT_44231 [Caerostris extrusa]|uniref:Uncharacterized protein n=1 Tax=Caerostris extrusa TaxID=172846 RepID=A0AAV4P988_CAEEX|nr:hypothetical protein CEXT_44231 [Caerostris extrusa]